MLTNEGEEGFRGVAESASDELRPAPEAFWTSADTGAPALVIPVEGTSLGWALAVDGSGLSGESRLIPFQAIGPSEPDRDGDGLADGGPLHAAGSVQVKDYDADGDDDLLVVDAARRRIILLQRDGDVLRPVQGAALAAAEPSLGISWMDTDDDGDLDIVLGQPGDITAQGSTVEAHGGAARVGTEDEQVQVPGLPGERPRPMADPPFDHGSDLTSSSLLDDDHPRYLNTDADDSFSDSLWTIVADTGGTDNKKIVLAGGGAADATDGAYVVIAGNDASPSGGSISINTGDEASSFVSVNAFGSSGGYVRLTHNDDGSDPEEVLKVDETGVSITSVGDQPLLLGEDVNLRFEGGTDDGNEVTLRPIDPTSDKFIDIPDASGTMLVSASTPLEFDVYGNVTCPTCSTAQMRTIEPWCTTHVGQLDPATADLAEVAPANGGTQTESSGINFPWDTAGNDDHYGVICQFIVPDDYDDGSATEPLVQIVGWSDTCLLCSPNCGTNHVVEFEIASRAYVTDDLANAAWGTDRTATLSWASESCGSPCSTTCWQSHRVKVGSADAVGAASEWAARELVFLRIRRDAAATNELQSGFHSARIAVHYPAH